MGTGRNNGGFTLLELLVTLVIAVMAVGIVAPRFSALVPGVELKGETQKVAALLRYARSRAIAEGTVIAVSMNDDPIGIQVTGKEALYHWSGSIDIKLESRLTQSEETAEILFYPNGSATGGSVSIGSDTRNYQVNVNWLTGRVAVDE